MPLTTGEPAPDFTLTSQHGESVTLSSFRGDRHVLLVFFPFAFSGICTGELAALRDQLDALASDGAAVLTVSCDHFFSNRAFADRDGLTFPVLSDFWPHGEVARSYGVFDDGSGGPRRGSFVIDREGLLRWQVINGAGEARAVADYRRALADLS